MGQMQMLKQFWVIGGEYRDTSFRELANPQIDAHGPFSAYDEALLVWRELTNASRADACVRYTIAANAGGNA